MTDSRTDKLRLKKMFTLGMVKEDKEEKKKEDSKVEYQDLFLILLLPFMVVSLVLADLLSVATAPCPVSAYPLFLPMAPIPSSSSSQISGAKITAYIFAILTIIFVFIAIPWELKKEEKKDDKKKDCDKKEDKKDEKKKECDKKEEKKLFSLREQCHKLSTKKSC